jgi:hypothetical protein
LKFGSKKKGAESRFTGLLFFTRCGVALYNPGQEEKLRSRNGPYKINNADYETKSINTTTKTLTTGPDLEHVAYVDDKGAGNGRSSNPLSVLGQYLQTCA